MDSTSVQNCTGDDVSHQCTHEPTPAFSHLSSAGVGNGVARATSSISSVPGTPLAAEFAAGHEAEGDAAGQDSAAPGRVVKPRLLVEVVVLAVLLVVTWVVLSLPIIVYHVPVMEAETSNDNNNISNVPENGSISEPLECREDFFRDEELLGACVPSCHTWEEFSPAEVIVTDVIITGSAVVGFLSGLAVIIISCIRFKRMFKFPSVLVIYLTLDLMVIQIFMIVSHFDRPSLYCKSTSLLNSILESTPFCVISGIVFAYGLLQIAIWWMFHTTALFWKVHFPLHARSVELSHRIKYIHATAVVVGLVVSLVSVVTPMADFAVDLQTDEMRQSRNITFLSGGLGFRLGRFPPVVCSAADSDAVFYSTVLPINLLVLVGITELVLIFYTVHKHHGIFKQKTSHGLKISAAERKILIALCYYVVVAVFSLTSFTLSTRNSGPFAVQLQDYFACERPGHDPSNPCDRSGFRRLTHPEVTAVAFALLNLFPAINLIYAINVMELRNGMCCGRRRRKIFKTDTQSINMP